MGTWGVGILSDDFARDVYDEYLERYDDGSDHPAIFAALKTRFGSELNDRDDGPLFWLAVARAQWDCGALDAIVYHRIEAIVANGEGLDRWQDEGGALLAKRQRALATFLEKLRTPRPRPRRRRSVRKKEAIYEPGTCLALRLPDGEYGAAIVLAVDDKSLKSEDLNLVGVLDYKSPTPPTQPVFEARKWLTLTHHEWKQEPARFWCHARFHRRDAHLLQVVGRTRLRWRDPTKGKFDSPWSSLVEAIFNQNAWDNGYRGDIAGA